MKLTEKTQVQTEFENICAVPRRSGHNEKIIQYVINEAKKLGLAYIFDDKNGNVIIKKPASPGKRDRTPIVLQGHLDMVADAEPGIEHDFDTEPLDIYTEGDFYRAKGTTLGGDDGIAPAIAFALLKDDTFANPPLEILFTTDEETGMLSVQNADFTFLDGKYLLNLDNETEGMFIIGCAGGARFNVSVPVKTEQASGTLYKIEISGLKGGHSGEEIGNERANAIRLLAGLLDDAEKQFSLHIKSFDAGGADNIISCHAACEIVLEGGGRDFLRFIRQYQTKYRFMYRKSDPKIKIDAKESGEFSGGVLTRLAACMLETVIMQLPSGVIAKEQDDMTKTETSCNIGMADFGSDCINITCLARSSVAEKMELLLQQAENLCRFTGAGFTMVNSYPAWTADYASPIIAPAKKAYIKLLGKEPVVDVIHAGLECGYILSHSNLKGAIALGAEIKDIHTPKERLSISSLNRTYELVKEILESI